MRNFVKAISSLLILAIIALCAVVGYYTYSLPNSFFVTRGTHLKLNCDFDITSAENKVISISQMGDMKAMDSKVTLKLFGLVPIKEVNVKQVDTPVLVPGGNPFGIKLLTEGVMVIGTSDVDIGDSEICPATLCGIQTGDIIVSMDGVKMTSNQDIANAIMKSQGGSVNVKLKRQSETLNVTLKPAYSLKESVFKAGMWVRDSSAGIGTITFYDPQTEMFGGLGHPVCDVDTGEIIPLHSGEVISVNIGGANKGKSGQPGELIGSFVSNTPIGKILINNQSGLFGTLDSAPNQSSPIPLGYRQDIKEGHATILTTIKGNSPKEYDIEIEKIDMNGDQDSKNMVIKITDPDLLKETGGIVQGMSGSPIIQNGKLIGAVTHVFVNDPTKGYGVFADTMYKYTENVQNKAA